MQSDPKEIYKLTALRTGEDEQVYKDIGNTVFAHLNNQLRKPPSLIMKLKGIGSWYLRRKRMQIITQHYPADSSPEHEKKMELHNLFLQRLEEYEKYIEIRNEIRTKRRETQVLIQPPQGEDEG